MSKGFANNRAGWPTAPAVDSNIGLNTFNPHDQPTPLVPNARRRKTLYENYPGTMGHRNHFASMAVGIEGEAIQCRHLAAVERERIENLKVDLENQRRVYDQQSYPVTKDADGNLVRVDWEAPFNEQIEKSKKKVAELDARRIALPRDRTNDCNKFAASAGGYFNELEIADFYNGKSVAVCWENLIALKKKRVEIENIGRTFEEMAAVIRADLEARANAGALEFDSIVAGSIDSVFFPQRTQFQDVPGIGGFNIEYEDSFGMALWLQPELIDRALDRVKKSLVGQKTISKADKDKLLKTIDADIMTARRNLEAAIRRDEDEGKRHKRMKDTPPQVLLWIEPASAPPRQVVQPVETIEPATEGADFG